MEKYYENMRSMCLHRNVTTTENDSVVIVSNIDLVYL